MAKEMMKLIHIALLAVLVLAGCSRQKPNVGATTFTVSARKGSKQTSYQLLPDGQKVLDSLLARKPDTDISAPVCLLPTTWFFVDGQRYAISTDEIVLLGYGHTKVWKRTGIRKDLIDKSRKLKRKPNQAIDGD